MSVEVIKNIMQKYGKYNVKTKKYNRFKADNNRYNEAKVTTEYLHILQKR
jgi:adenine-specific DNA-methyltransferase